MALAHDSFLQLFFDDLAIESYASKFWIYFWIFSKTSGFKDVFFLPPSLWSDIGSTKPTVKKSRDQTVHGEKKLAVSRYSKTRKKHDIGWRGRMGNPISSDLLKHDNDTINTGCSLDDSNGLANCTTSPTVFVLACCSPLTGNGRCCLVFVSEEENSKKHPLLSTLEMMDAKGKRLDILDLIVPTLPFTPTFGLVAASRMVNVGKGKCTTRLLCLPTRVKSLFEGPHPEKT